MSHQLISFPNDVALAQEVAGRWLDELAARNNSATTYSVALSGGRIAKTFFSEVVRQAREKPISFAGVHFFWADERCVPPTDPESNYAVAKQLLFEPLNIPEDQIHRIRGEEIEALALRDAVSNICSVTKGTREGQPVVDLILLGMGEDGHVASLFPGEPEAVMESPDVYRAVTAVKPPPRRITMGYRTIAAAAKVWVLVSGAGKERALGESLSPTGKTPLARVLRQREKIVVFSDVLPAQF
ncbi:MAG: pgl [Pedosphaera sp.]|nr:pgl [Pedosphaera sp.]